MIVNREHWLSTLADMMKPIFKGFKIAPFKITCGWPARFALPSPRGYRQGECHSGKASPAGFYEIFVSPLVAEPLEVAGIVCHELAHVVAGIEAGHGKLFMVVCNHVGLTKGDPNQASPGPFLEEILKGHIDKLGPYPHSPLRPYTKKVRVTVPPVKLICPNCECKFSMSRKYLDNPGLPRCGCGTPMVQCT